MDPLAIEEHSALLLSAYLDSLRSDIGLPASDVLKFIAPYSIEDISGHRLCFPSASVDWKSPHNPVVTLAMEMQTVAYGEGREAPATDAAWNAAIRRALIDDAAWQTYLTGLSDADRTGWKLLARPVLRNGAVEVDTQDQIRKRSTDIILNFRVD